jgi:quercetin dioxygenase-like cupin family protein
MKRKNLLAAIVLGLFLSQEAVAQQPAIVSKPIAEKKVTDLPNGPLFWRVENFPTIADAQAKAGSHSLPPQYLLRVNEGSGVPGSTTSVHTHPGSEAYYVLSGEASQKTTHGVSRISAGQTLAGHGADTVMQFMNSGTTNVSYFALFVVDGTKPFTSPAKFD